MKRFLCVLLCLLMLFSLASCFPFEKEPPEESGTPYDLILEEYRSLLLAKRNGETHAVSTALPEDIRVTLLDVVENGVDPAAMGYAIKDINKDGTDELILFNKGLKAYALFTAKEFTPILLLKTAPGAMYILPDGTVYADIYIPDECNVSLIKRLVDGKLVGMEVGVIHNGEAVSYYKEENGIRTEATGDEAYAFKESLNPVLLSHWQPNRVTGFLFVPAIPDEAAVPAPAADFSSYEGILAAYKKIIGVLPDYTQEKWRNGEYDTLFSFSDNESYDLFNTLLLSVIWERPTKTHFGSQYAENGENAFGYAVKDLNRDGTKEMILLTDTYKILAVFTVRNQKAVLLSDTYGVWIDKDGRIYSSESLGGVVDRDGELFRYELQNGALVLTAGVGFTVNAYLEKEGWYTFENSRRVSISKEEGERLYQELDVCHRQGLSPEEYVKTLSGISFTPLFERATLSQAHLNRFTTFRSNSSITVTDFSEETVSFTFVYTHTIMDPYENYKTTIEGVAQRNGHTCEFEQDGIKGYLEFGVNSIWVTVQESENEYIRCKTYLFNDPDA